MINLPQNFNIDTLIFIAFLAVNLIFGLMSSKGVSTLRGYSVGDKKFTTATIVSTLVATWIGGPFFFTIVKESYTQGLGFIIVAALGNFLSLFIIGKFFAPKMKMFLNKLSIAEAMGDLYGKHVRIITAIAGFFSISSGVIAIQLSISGILFQYALGTSLSFGIVISGLIITLYSSLGVVKSVTCTDTIQFITPVIFLVAALYKFGLEEIVTTSSSSSKFKIAYLIVLIGSILIIFLKPKQEYIKIT